MSLQIFPDTGSLEGSAKILNYQRDFKYLVAVRNNNNNNNFICSLSYSYEYDG